MKFEKTGLQEKYMYYNTVSILLHLQWSGKNFDTHISNGNQQKEKDSLIRRKTNREKLSIDVDFENHY